MLFGRTLHSTLTGINYISLNWNLVLDGLFEGSLLQVLRWKSLEGGTSNLKQCPLSYFILFQISQAWLPTFGIRLWCKKLLGQLWYVVHCSLSWVSNDDVDDMDMVNNGISQPLSNHAKAVTWCNEIDSYIVTSIVRMRIVWRRKREWARATVSPAKSLLNINYSILPITFIFS